VKVIGTGTPASLTITFQPCEIELAHAELQRTRAALISARAAECERDTEDFIDVPDEVFAGDNRAVAELFEARRLRFRATFDDGGGTSDPTIGGHDEELAEIAYVLGQLYAAQSIDDRPVQITGPTWLLATVVRNASEAALAQLVDAVRRFRAHVPRSTPRELAAAADTASAWAQTLVEYHHVDNHGLADYGHHAQSGPGGPA
jgi:hypothetical protein